jgi:hypothetical protein
VFGVGNPLTCTNRRGQKYNEVIKRGQFTFKAREWHE